MRVFLSFFLILCSLESFPQERLATFEVNSGDHDRFNTPVSVSLDGIRFTHDSLDLVLVETTDSGRKPLPCQLESGYSPRLWWILSGSTKAGTVRTFELIHGKKSADNSAILVTESDGGTILSKNDRELIKYNHAVAPPPEGIDQIFGKSGFIHPLWSPGGDILTRIQPPDHYHHYGIWGPYTRTRIDDHNTDFWNIGDGQGTVLFSSYKSIITGPVFSEINVLQDHIDYLAKGADKTAMNEELSIRIWNINGSEDSYLWDYTTTITSATNQPVKLLQYRYGGGIGFRAHESWMKENSIVLTSEGLDRSKADGTRARWCDVAVKKNNSEITGILFLSNPNNRQHPEPMRVWPLDANANRGDMFFEFCPIRHKSWMIEPGKSYTLKYRMLVHDGNVEVEKAERYWRDFADPPGVTRVLK